jgi:hypothetical protein
MKIKFKQNHYFRGAVNGRKYECQAGKLINIEEAEIIHISKDDYVVISSVPVAGDVSADAMPEQKEPKKGKKK